MMKTKIWLVYIVAAFIFLPSQANSALKSKLVRGDQTCTVMHDGVSRQYILHFPVKFDQRLTYPVFLVLHGGNSTAAQMKDYTKFNTYADQKHVVAVYPQGLPSPGQQNFWWNDGRTPTYQTGDDVGFIKDLLKDLARHGVRVGKTYAVGMSNGAQMALRLGKELPEISGVVAACGHRGPNEWIDAPGRPIPVLFIQGYEDPFCLFDGGVGGSGLEFKPFPDVLVEWLTYNSCGNIPDQRVIVGQAEFWKYNGEAPVGVWVCYDNGHQWPGANFNYALWLAGCGPINHDIQASEQAIKFYLE
jgi:polyhydroxybutyrate depolymerase